MTLFTTKLNDTELEYCKNIAKKRIDFNKNHNDIKSYDHNRFNLSSLQSNFLALTVEVALCKFLDVNHLDPRVYCGFSRDYKDFQKPDVLGVFEARRANKQYSPLPVRTKDVKANAIIVQGYAPYEQKGKDSLDDLSGYGTIHWNGWMCSHDAWRVGDVPEWSYNKNDRTVPQKDINTDMGQLWEHYMEHHKDA